MVSYGYRVLVFSAVSRQLYKKKKKRFCLVKDTLCICLVYGLVRLVDVLHSDGVRKLVEHPLLESLQPLVVMAAAHKLFILQHRARGF